MMKPRNNDKYSIGFIVCYVGKLPWYFNYFIHSCKYNDSIDFIIVTDDREYQNPLPKNVKLVYKTLKEINDLACYKLGFQTQIEDGYKLCDFKPTYGLLFSELLQNYDFWGHGDIDVIFGNIREFMTNEILKKFELVSVRHDFLTGQFLLFRNNKKMNSLFTLSKDYKKVLSSSTHFCFDETNFRWQDFTDNKSYSRIDSEIESMTHLVKRLANEKYLDAYFDFLIIEGIPGKLKWDKGKLVYKNKYEVMMYHLVLFKKICKQKKVPNKIPENFSISPSTIYHG